MRDFSFLCTHFIALLRMGRHGGLYFYYIPSVSTFSTGSGERQLCLNSTHRKTCLKTVSQTMALQLRRYESMKAWVGFMNRDILNTTSGERAQRVRCIHPPPMPHYLSPRITYSKPGKPNRGWIPGHPRSAAGAVIFHIPGRSLVPSLPSLIHAQDWKSRLQAKHANTGATPWFYTPVKISRALKTKHQGDKAAMRPDRCSVRNCAGKSLSHDTWWENCRIHARTLNTRPDLGSWILLWIWMLYGFHPAEQEI